jgi:DNA-3-methyladenine glycosylase
MRCPGAWSTIVAKLSWLPCSFFERDPLVCARELIGAELMWGKCSGIIVETEAYLTLNDEACHTFTRPSTRAFVERNRPGAVYIYMNYGVHWMLNLLVKGSDRTGLILVRALEPRRGLRLMKARRGLDDIRRLCSGPGKLAQALDITKRHHEMSICADSRHCLLPPSETDVRVVADPRIGISRAKNFPWRFTLAESPFVSVPVRPALTRRRTAMTLRTK